MPEPRPTTDLHVLLTGGGSGGHVFPALAVAERVRETGGRVSFVGAEGGFEARLVPERGIPFTALPARPLVGRGLVDKARGGATLAASGWRARAVVRKLEPDVVLGTGGYVSAPAVLGARLAGVPVVLLEPNADPGAANRFLSRFARGACLAFPEAGERLRCPGWVTGVPVRESFFAVPTDLPPGAPLRLLVLGGSQGAQQLNRELPEALSTLRDAAAPWTVLHQAGERHVATATAAYEAAGLAERAEVVPFLSDVASAMAGSHLVISRAGAITLAELCAAGRGSILVPLAIAEGHQRGNARALERAGAARVVEEPGATTLSALLATLLGDRAGLEAMARAARALGKPEAVDRIVDRLREVAA